MPEQVVESKREADVATLTLDRRPHNIRNLMALEDARKGIERKLQGRTPEWRDA